MLRTITPKSKLKQHKDESDNFYTKEELKKFFICLKQLKDKRVFTFFRIFRIEKRRSNGFTVERY